MTTHEIETIVIGGGQAGLNVGYHLAQRGRPFLILDASERLGDAWRQRWDSLKLFTPAKFDGLAGMDFPGDGDAFIRKDEMADFLESYARSFDLPVRNSARVDRLSKRGDRYEVVAGSDTYLAANVVVAMSTYQKPRVPDFAAELSSDVVQMHSSAYRNPSQLRDGGVLIVGAGNSGADIALELSAERPTWLSGRDVGQIPFRIETKFALNVGIHMVRFVGHHVLNTGTPVGRKVRKKMLHAAGPRVRVKTDDLVNAGVRLVSRVAKVKGGKPVLDSGETVDVPNVIWATGYSGGFSWIDLPIFDGEDPRHVRGIVPDHPGLYFVGLHFLHAATSSTITGVQRDARHIVKHLDARMKRTHALQLPQAARSETTTSENVSLPERELT